MMANFQTFAFFGIFCMTGGVCVLSGSVKDLHVEASLTLTPKKSSSSKNDTSKEGFSVGGSAVVVETDACNVQVNKRLMNFTKRFIDAVQEIKHCATRCAQDQGCRSAQLVTLTDEQTVCLLNSATISEHPEATIDSDTSIYFEPCVLADDCFDVYEAAKCATLKQMDLCNVCTVIADNCARTCGKCSVV